MIRLKSILDNLEHKTVLPTLAYIRGMQFICTQGYQPEIDGWLVVWNKVTT